MVEVRLKKHIMVLFILCMDALAGSLLVHSIFIVKNSVYIVFAAIVSLMALLFTVILYNAAKHYRLIFDDAGITRKNKITVGSMLFHDKVEIFPWAKVLTLFCVDGDFFDNFLLELDEKRMFIHLNRPFVIYENIRIKLDYLKTNRKEALEFAVTKLPRTCEITTEAGFRLREKYGIRLPKRDMSVPNVGI